MDDNRENKELENETEEMQDDDLEIEIIDDGDPLPEDEPKESTEDSEAYERKDIVMDVLIAVGATFIIMFATFGVLKLNSALRSATILNRSTTALESATQEESETESETDETIERNTTLHTTPALKNDDYTTTEENTTETKKVEETTTKATDIDTDTNEDNYQSIIDNISITPCTTGYAPLDGEVNRILSGLSGGTYDKLQGIYNYLVRNISEGTITANDENVFSMLGEVQYGSSFDAYRIYEAYQTLTGRRGSYSGYASAFMVLARGLGANAYYVTGKSYKTGNEHAWVIIDVRGQEFIFDPFLDDKYKENGNIKYNFFCKKQINVPGMYLYKDKASDRNSYGGFNTVSSMTLNVKLGNITAACKWTPSLDMLPCENSASEYFGEDVGSNVEIKANVPGSGLNEWKITLKNIDTEEEKELASEKQGTTSYSYIWTPEQGGNYLITVTAKDVLGRECRVSVEARIQGNQPISGLNVTQRTYEETDKEAYIIEADAIDGVGDIQYDFRVFCNDELVDKSWIKWNTSSSIIVTIPDNIPKGSNLLIKVAASDDANNKMEQEIKISTKGNKYK